VIALPARNVRPAIAIMGPGRIVLEAPSPDPGASDAARAPEA